MKSYTRLIAAELIKIKNTAALWLVFSAAVFIPVLQIAAYLHKPEQVRLGQGENPWISFSENSFAMSEVFILPMFVAMIVGLLMNIEHKYHTWKHIFVMPVPKQQLFLAKLSMLAGMVLAFFCLFALLVLADGWFLTTYLKNANPGHFGPDWGILSTLFIQSFIAVLPVLAIHFWLSFRVKNLIVNMGIGMTGVILGLILASPGTWGPVIYFPYAYPSILAYSLNPNYHYPEFPAQAYSLIWFSVVTLLCYFDFRRNFKG
jgi:hypothetical protein